MSEILSKPSGIRLGYVRKMPTPRRVVIVGYHLATLLDISCPADVFDAANRIARRDVYDIALVSPDGGPIRCQNGITLSAHTALSEVTGTVDTLMVAGGIGHIEAARDPRLVAQFARLARHSRRVASVCSGTTILAATGLLNGRRATTHWSQARRLAAAHPRIEVDPAPLFIKDGNIFTSAGVTSGLDMTLRFVEDDLGSTVARSAARALVTYLQRPANQAQISMFLAAGPPQDRAIADLTAHISSHLDTDLSTAALAARVGVGERQLTRLFAAQLGTTPARYVRSVRTEAAAKLLSGAALPLTAVARRCGFGSPETLRQAFADTYGTTPARYRQACRTT